MMSIKEGILSAALVVVLSSMTVSAANFQAVPFSLPSPPKLVGTLASNYALYYATRIHQNKIKGAASFAFLNGNVYTVTADWKVVNIAVCPPKVIATLSKPGCRGYPQCGVLTSIRVDKTKQFLYVLDAYRGLFSVSIANGAVKQLFSSNTLVAGRAPKYLADFVVLGDNSVLITDASDKWTIQEYLYIIMEGRASGRVIMVKPSKNQALEFVKNIAYPRGIELTADGSRVLVAESGRARVLSFGILKNNLRQKTVFSQNLPGCPTNIRRTDRGTYWVALDLVRHAGIPNSMDYYSNNIAARVQTVWKDKLTKIKTYYPRYGLIVEIDGSGRVIRSLHDPTGRVYNNVLEASEHGGVMYVGHYGKTFVGQLINRGSKSMTAVSLLQVMRSRCLLDESKLSKAKAALQKFLDSISKNKQTKVQPGSVQPKTVGKRAAGLRKRDAGDKTALALQDRGKRLQANEIYDELPVYSVTVWTGTMSGAGTDAKIYMIMYGPNGATDRILLPEDAEFSKFEKNDVDTFEFQDVNVGPITHVWIGHDNTGREPAWYLKKMTIRRHLTLMEKVANVIACCIDYTFVLNAYVKTIADHGTNMTLTESTIIYHDLFKTN